MEIQAYYYIILASQERESVLESLASNFAFSFGLKMTAVAFSLAFIAGLLLIWRFTKNLSPIEKSMKDFELGNYHSRINLKGNDFKQLARTYNSMAHQIQMNIDKIKSIDDFRKEFIANISHDLRSPLVVINGYAEMLQMKGDELTLENREKYLGYIMESTRQMEGLLNQLLELSKLENNQIDVVKEPFDLTELISDLLGRFDVLLKKKNVNVIYQKPMNIPLAYGDISLIERAIQNLIDNAIKYSPENSKIDLDVLRQGDQLFFSISDQGKGIEEARLSKIFEPYEREENMSADIKSVGLGLAIVKRIIELHQSSIKVVSKLNEGSTFSFGLSVAV